MAYQYQQNGDLVINGWEVGISNSPYQTQTSTALIAQGVSDLRNVDIITVPGEASVAMATINMITQGSISGVTFTVDHTTGIFTYNGIIPLEVNTAIIVSNSGGALPTGMSANTPYYVNAVSTTNFTLSASAGGTVLSLSDNGSGTNTFSTIDMGTPLYFTSTILNNFHYYFLQDSNGRIWVYGGIGLGSGKWVYMNSATTGTENPTFKNTANGLIAYSGYLFFMTSGYISVISILNPADGLIELGYLTTHSNWFFNWQILLAVADNRISHESIVSQLNQVLICNGSQLASISTVPGSLASTFLTPFNLVPTTHTVADGVTTSGSANISTVTAFFQSTDVGAVIVGTGIPTGTTIASVTDSKHAVLLLTTATASATGLTFTISKAYNYSPNILLLLPGDQATCLTELGNNCLIGGLNHYIYPWDEVSVSYDSIIRLSEEHTYKMVTVNTTTYIFTGNRGRVFYTNGSNVQLYAKMPDHLSGTVNPFYTWYGVTFNRNQIYFGVSATDNQGSNINTYGGMWAIDTDTASLRMLNESSYGTTTGYVSALIPYRGDYIYNTTQYQNGYGMFTGWYNGTIGGVDKGISTPYTGGQSYVETDIVPVGTYLDKKTFENIGFRLTTPLVSDESISLYYRTNITENYTLIPLLSGGQVGDIAGYGSANFQNVLWLQIRAYLTSTATNPSYVRLKDIIVK